MCLCRDYMSDRQELDGETVLKGGDGAKTRCAEKLETKLGRKKRKEKKSDQRAGACRSGPNLGCPLLPNAMTRIHYGGPFSSCPLLHASLTFAMKALSRCASITKVRDMKKRESGGVVNEALV